MKRSVTFVAGMSAGMMVAGGVWLGVEALSSDVLAQGAGPAPAAAKAPAAGQKNTSRVVLENDKVIVKEAIFYPGDKNPGMHTHKLPHVGVIIEGGTLQFKSPDGKVETLKLETGGAGYREANVTHEPINVGTARVRVIEVEIK